MDDNALEGRFKCKSSTIFKNLVKISYLELINLYNEIVFDINNELWDDSENGTQKGMIYHDRINGDTTKEIGIRHLRI